MISPRGPTLVLVLDMLLEKVMKSAGYDKLGLGDRHRRLRSRNAKQAKNHATGYEFRMSKRAATDQTSGTRSIDIAEECKSILASCQFFSIMTVTLECLSWLPYGSSPPLSDQSLMQYQLRPLSIVLHRDHPRGNARQNKPPRIRLFDA